MLSMLLSNHSNTIGAALVVEGGTFGANWTDSSVILEVSTDSCNMLEGLIGIVFRMLIKEFSAILPIRLNDVEHSVDNNLKIK